MAIIETSEGGVTIRVKVVPNASRDQIVGPLGEALKIKVVAPPEAGKANAAVIRLLAGALGIAERDIHVITGQSQANKRLAIAGIDPATAADRLGLG